MTAQASTMVDQEWDDVEIGSTVPGFELPITMKTLVLAAIGTRDVMPYHHNREFCFNLGIRDAFVNTTYIQALMSRAATDWSGPSATLRSMTLSMTDQLCVGDTARVSGAVGRKWSEGDRHLVELDLTVAIDAGAVAARAPVVLCLRRGDSAPRPFQMSVDPPAVELDPDMPAEMRGRLDERMVRVAPFPVSEAQIGYWADMVRDRHPAYVCSAHRSDGIGTIAPAASVSIWNLSRTPQLGIDAAAPDVDAPEQSAWPEPVDTGWPFEWRSPGAREVIVQKRHAEFGTPIRPGDLIRSTAQLLNCSGRRTTKLGDGYFVLRYEVYQNQDDAVVGSTMMSLFQYGLEGSRRS